MPEPNYFDKSHHGGVLASIGKQEVAVVDQHILVAIWVKFVGGDLEASRVVAGAAAEQEVLDYIPRRCGLLANDFVVDTERDSPTRRFRAHPLHVVKHQRSSFGPVDRVEPALKRFEGYVRCEG